MIRHEDIPKDVWHTAMSTYHKTIKKRPGSAWQEALAAALNAWKPSWTETECDNAGMIVSRQYVLDITPEENPYD